jgi:hypothetical protein
MDQFVVEWSMLIILRTMRSRSEWLLMMHIDYSVCVVEILLSLSVHRRNHWRDLYLYLPKSISLWLYGGLFLFFLVLRVIYIFTYLVKLLRFTFKHFYFGFLSLEQLRPAHFIRVLIWKNGIFIVKYSNVLRNLLHIGILLMISADKNNFIVILPTELL